MPVAAEQVNNPMEAYYFNAKHGAKKRQFVAGEKVLARLDPKSIWQNAEIIESKGRVCYTILMNGRVIKAHANQLRSNAVKDPAKDDNLDLEVLCDEPQTVASAAPAVPAPPRVRRYPRAVTRSSPPVLRSRRGSN